MVATGCSEHQLQKIMSVYNSQRRFMLSLAVTAGCTVAYVLFRTATSPLLDVERAKFQPPAPSQLEVLSPDVLKDAENLDRVAAHVVLEAVCPSGHDGSGIRHWMSLRSQLCGGPLAHASRAEYGVGGQVPLAVYVTPSHPQ